MIAMLATMKLSLESFVCKPASLSNLSFVGVIDGHGNCSSVMMMMMIMMLMMMLVMMLMMMTLMIKRSAKPVEGH